MTEYNVKEFSGPVSSPWSSCVVKRARITSLAFERAVDPAGHFSIGGGRGCGESCNLRGSFGRSLAGVRCANLERLARASGWPRGSNPRHSQAPLSAVPAVFAPVSPEGDDAVAAATQSVTFAVTSKLLTRINHSFRGLSRG